jgi:GT2 family glycosyltransferase
MIPTFNTPPAFLKVAVKSVLAQDPGSQTLQITVVDDASSEGDAAAVVSEVSQGRVEYVRNDQNLGQARNLNRCIALARGNLVHLLHADDYVMPGFYPAMAEAAGTHATAGLIACRSHFVDANGASGGVTRRLPELESPSCNVSSFYYDTPIQTPSVVVRRRCYEQLGGFTPDFHYAVDTEMWVRVIGHCSGVVVPDVLACYRIHGSNLTARVVRDGTTVRETERLNLLFADRFPAFSRRRGRRRVAKMAWSLYMQLRAAGDKEAAEMNRRLWVEVAPLGLRVRYAVKFWTYLKWTVPDSQKLPA